MGHEGPPLDQRVAELPQPHNLVIVAPGKHLEIGTAAMTLRPDNLDKIGRAHLPAAYEKDILAATKLLEPGQHETLRMTAPSKPCDYGFVCTFPGHAVIMWGVLSVAAP